MHIEQVARANRSRRITQAMRRTGPTQDVVAFAADDDERAVSRRLVLQNIGEAVPRDRRHAGLFADDAHQVEKGRCQIDETDEVRHAAIGLRDSLWPTCHEGNAVRVVERVAFDARERHA